MMPCLHGEVVICQFRFERIGSHNLESPGWVIYQAENYERRRHVI